jgi:hypothetical protein
VCSPPGHNRSLHVCSIDSTILLCEVFYSKYKVWCSVEEGFDCHRAAIHGIRVVLQGSDDVSALPAPTCSWHLLKPGDKVCVVRCRP